LKKQFDLPGDHAMYNLQNESGVLHTIAMKQKTLMHPNQLTCLLMCGQHSPETKNGLCLCDSAMQIRGCDAFGAE
jgi:hypothetical protein